VILDLPSEFPRTDERLMGRRYTTIFLPVVVPEKEGNGLPLPLSLNGLAKVNNKTKEKEIFFPGQKCLVEEPIFIPRSSDSPEGDGWVIAMIQRVEERKSDLVVIDTRDFTSPVAIIELPLYVRNQIHGNWVDAKSRSGDIVKPLCRDLGDVQVSGRGALGPLS
jgi:carotenoid cleavage dioxygenase